jgi:hypothetical protein
MTDKTVFETLSTIDVSGFTKKLKTNYSSLSYLSWADAWKNLKITYPNASFKIIKDSDTNLPYVGSDIGAMVFTEMSIEGVTHEMWLPVMDNNNQAMKKVAYKYKVKNGEREVKAMTMFDVNTALMRCLTKNMAMFGLGLNIYTGEDLPLTHEDFLSEEELKVKAKADAKTKAKAEAEAIKEAEASAKKQDLINEYVHRIDVNCARKEAGEVHTLIGELDKSIKAGVWSGVSEMSKVYIKSDNYINATTEELVA